MAVADAGQNDLGVGSSGISDKMKGAVRSAEGQRTIVGGGGGERKGEAMSAT